MKKYGKYTISGWSWRILLGVVLTPIVLFAIVALLIYFPPVQKWAVDKAAEYLSEEMGMEVTVESVCLKFPLDLSVGGMLAVQEGDTILNAEELRLSAQWRPLLEGQVNVDDIVLKNADVNTRDFIDEVLIKGHIGELQAYTHGVDLKGQQVTVNKLDLKESSILVALPDTVPPDTTTKKTTKWKLDFQDINLEKVKFSLALAQKKNLDIKQLRSQRNIPVYLDADFNKAKCRALVDLENGAYIVNDLVAEKSDARVDKSVKLTEVDLECDSIRYSNHMNLYVGIKQLAGKEKCGLNFKNVKGLVTADSLDLYIKDLDVLTDDSKFNINMKMDWNAWDDVEPGIMQLDLNSSLGKSDVMSITRYVDRFLAEDSKLDAVRNLAQEYVPVKPVPLKVNVIGNLEDLHFDDIQTNIDGIGYLEGKARMRGDEISTDLRGKLAGGVADAKGTYNIATEAYDVDLNLNDFDVNRYADLGENTRLTGNVKARGRGFDPYDKKTDIIASADIKKGNYGKIDLSSLKADVNLKGGATKLSLGCNNSQLKTDLIFDGTLAKSGVTGHVNLDLPFADVKSMGYSKDHLTVSTAGTLDFSTDMKHRLSVDSYMQGLDLTMGEKDLHTDDFYFEANSLPDSIYALLKTGDLDFELNAPYSLNQLMDKSGKLMTVFEKQVKDRNVHFDVIKTYLPDATIHASAGRNNPLSTILNANGIKFGELVANIDSSPEVGVVGNGHIYSLMYDSIRIDTAYFDVVQAADRFNFHSGVKSAEQPIFPAFSSTIDGYYKLDELDARLKFFNDQKDLGIDLGVHAVNNDSLMHVSFYPENPVVGYRRFKINSDNYFDIYHAENHPIIGYANLEGIDSNCKIAITGLDNEGEQRALVEIQNLNLGDMHKIIMQFPDIEGKFSCDCAYQTQGNRFWVDGTVNVDNLVYGGMKVGDVGSMFTYEPQGEGLNIHTLDGDISYNGIDVATLVGKYDMSGDGYLDANLNVLSVPMKMFSPFVPDQMVTLDGNMSGAVHVKGPADDLSYNGYALTENVTVESPYYSVKLKLADDTLAVMNNIITFDSLAIYGAGTNPLTLNGFVDFNDTDNMPLSLRLSGRNVKLIESKRTSKSVVFGDAYGDIFARVSGTTNDMSVRGRINVLPNTNLTYIMTDATISQGDRLDDIVTFVDFALPPDSTETKSPSTITGIDLRMNLDVQEGAKFRVEFSADKQSYVNLRGGGSLTANYTPEGVMNVQGRLTASEGEMKYTLPVIPLKTFKIENGSYVEFTGDIGNPTLNVSATERTKAQVGTETGSSRSVAFDVGLKITQTLNDMGLAFTIAAPEDVEVQEELDSTSDEEKYKLAVALLATGMYLSDSNSSAVTANNALSSFLQSQINNITGRALGNIVDVSLGMDQQTYSNNLTGYDYTFKFSKRFFSDRLSVSIGGRVSDNEAVNQQTGIGSFIDDVSLEWRLDETGTRYVRLFHGKDYENLVEGVLEKNGAGLVYRKKLGSMSDFLNIFRKNSSVSQPVVSPARSLERRNTTERNEAKKDTISVEREDSVTVQKPVAVRARKGGDE